jgi:hypothetical protein
VLPRPEALVRVSEVNGVVSVIRLIRTQANHRNEGAPQIVVAVNTHRVGTHVPAVDDTGRGFFPRSRL